LLFAGCSASSTPTPTAGVSGIDVINPPFDVSDFMLTDQHGAPLKMSSLSGKLVLMTFGYTHCPDICPINLANFEQVKRALDDLSTQVAFVFVSVDGARDTPAVLAKYLSAFDPGFIGLTGSEADTRSVTKDFGVIYSYQKKSPTDTDYTVTHTASSFLVSRSRQLIRIYDYGLDPKLIADDITKAAG
jgi:protein SCO1/2